MPLKKAGKTGPARPPTPAAQQTADTGLQANGAQFNGQNVSPTNDNVTASVHDISSLRIIVEEHSDKESTGDSPDGSVTPPELVDRRLPSNFIQLGMVNTNSDLLEAHLAHKQSSGSTMSVYTMASGASGGSGWAADNEYTPEPTPVPPSADRNDSDDSFPLVMEEFHREQSPEEEAIGHEYEPLPLAGPLVPVDSNTAWDNVPDEVDIMETVASSGRSEDADDAEEALMLAPQNQSDHRSQQTVLANPIAPAERTVNPTDIKIDTRNKGAPLKWLAIGAVVCAVAGAIGFGAAAGVAGTAVVPGIGTVAGLASGIFAGAAFGAVVGATVGLGVGLYRLIKTAQNGHIKAALRRFDQKWYTFTRQEKQNLEDPRISGEQWRDLLHVPGKHFWSRNDEAVANKADRQKIREALIMAMAKTDGPPQTRLAEAQALKDELLATSPAGVRGYRVLDANDLGSLEPDRIWTALDFIDQEHHLSQIDNGLGDAYRDLVRDGALDDHGKHYLSLISNENLRELTSNLGDTHPKDCHNIRQALLLCAAKEGYGKANELKAKLLSIHSIRIPNDRRGVEEDVTLRDQGYVALRAKPIWNKLRAGQSDSIDFTELTHANVDRTIAHLKRCIVRNKTAKEYIDEVVHFIESELKREHADLTPERRYNAVSHAAAIMGTLQVKDPTDIHEQEWSRDAIRNEQDWSRDAIRNHTKDFLSRSKIASSALRQLVAGWGIRPRARRRNAGDRSQFKYAKKLEGFLQIGSLTNASPWLMVKQLRSKVGQSGLDAVLKRIGSNTKGKFTRKLRKKVVALIDSPDRGPERAGMLLAIFMQKAKDLSSVRGERLSEVAAMRALQDFKKFNKASLADLDREIETDVPYSEMSSMSDFTANDDFTATDGFTTTDDDT